MSRYTATFAEADPEDLDRFGGKGAGLARMTRAGLRVPPGFVIGTDACRAYLSTGSVPDGLYDEVFARLAELEAATGKTFGAGPVPLLLSVRSGAPISMPGMMDTILNIGLDRDAAIALASATGDVGFVADLVARFHGMYAETVLGALEPADVPPPSSDDPGAVYTAVWEACTEAVLADVGESVPAGPREQVVGAVEAVFRSWNTRRARTYRKHHDIPDALGTAVVVQAMVFGNLGDDSGSGVVFTRNPVDGTAGPFGEFLTRSQGEDVVAGVRTPEPLAAAAGRMPEPFAELLDICPRLERDHGDVLDIEFTIERSTLYLLQVRSAKRTPAAAVRIAADLLGEGLMEPAQALAAVSVEQVRQVQRPSFDPDAVAAARADGRLVTTGIGASPGHTGGLLVLDSDRAEERAAAGETVVLARPVTSPADLHGMLAATGIVTSTGGSTSHAAVVARALGKPCVVGCSAATIDPAAGTLTVAGRTLLAGDPVSLDGASGEVFAGELPLTTPAVASEALAGLLDVAARAAGSEVVAAAGTATDPAWRDVSPDDPDASLSGVGDPSTTGVRLTGTVPSEVADDLYRRGFRRYAVDPGEVGPLTLALGQVALGLTSRTPR